MYSVVPPARPKRPWIQYQPLSRFSRDSQVSSLYATNGPSGGGAHAFTTQVFCRFADSAGAVGPELRDDGPLTGTAEKNARWVLCVRAMGVLQRAGRLDAAAVPRFREEQLLGELRAARARVLEDPAASAHGLLKRLNKALLERPARRADLSAADWTRRVFSEAAELAGAQGDEELRRGALAAIAEGLGEGGADRGEENRGPATPTCTAPGDCDDPAAGAE
eukprot:tig00020542_g10445.t1